MSFAYQCNYRSGYKRAHMLSEFEQVRLDQDTEHVVSVLNGMSIIDTRVGELDESRKFDSVMSCSGG